MGEKVGKMDEKFLQEIRRQEQILDESGVDSPEDQPNENPEGKIESAEEKVEPTVAPPEGQRTLFGGDV